jgi:hypothetical protein
MVEPQIVLLVVAGSSPVGHPILKSQNPNMGFWDLGFWTLSVEISIKCL